jgi:hypothetical protein
MNLLVSSAIEFQQVEERTGSPVPQQVPGTTERTILAVVGDPGKVGHGCAMVKMARRVAARCPVLAAA